MAVKTMNECNFTFGSLSRVSISLIVSWNRIFSSIHARFLMPFGSTKMMC